MIEKIDNTPKNKKSLSVVRYFILALILLYIPGFTLTYFNGTLSSIFSYLSYGLILIYTIYHGKSGNNYWMIIIGLLYFLIGSVVNQEYMPEIKYFTIIMIKYFIIIIGGYEVMKRTSSKEMWFFMLLGALSILGNMFLFNDPKADYGRYSGFYLDPNNGGLICIMGYALSFAMPKKIRFIGKLLFTILGLFTFSRTFIVTWLIINVLSIRLDIKNAKMLFAGFAILSTLVIYNEFLPVKNARLEQIGAIISSDNDSSSPNKINKDSRWDTWKRYFPALSDKPIFGNGYMAFDGNGVAPPVGVHNTYLLIWGESGIFPILIFIYYLITLFKYGIYYFKDIPFSLMMLISLTLFLMTNHNFFNTDYSLLLILWIDIQLKNKKDKLSKELNFT
ncbi:hypothetical protein LCGC14_0132080 [marine sediment metagenome]|uniref:O-antigen ligase-related domain-containing protein n=1 Tax=marine sediment metagenome TaxID=412755 RepID=A0A0F9VJ15_9ZZZZ|nr:O-antigen ligase family protein [Maribacter sp.]HDZ03944.1 O-antigen ligase domain-containing protein [Maribacter sp.]HEC39444.1 O-antigen ligase domain-containing protein [bacterium]